MGHLLYGGAMLLLVLGIHLASLWHPGARAWVRGRKGWRRQLPPQREAGIPRVWFHVASLGEFEQARPVIESLKSKRPETDILLTFFSPSGYSQRQHYPLARVLYLPADVPGAAATWLAHTTPDMAVFVKYDLWPGYLRALRKRQIPAFLISAHWTPGTRWSSWSNPLVSGYLKSFQRIWLQRPDHLAWFRSRGFANLAVAGDTRIDRSLQLPGESAGRLPVELQSLAPFTLIAGSTWPADESILLDACQDIPGPILIVPHDVSEPHLNRLMEQVGDAGCRLSALSPTDRPKYLIVDRIGLLPYVYGLGRMAYIGGGFGRGIHNTLEPMAHARPVIVGPRHTGFPEVTEAIHVGAAIAIQDAASLREAILAWQEDTHCEAAGRAGNEYLLSRRGATPQIVDYLLESLPWRPS